MKSFTRRTSFPPRSVFGIFENDAALNQFIAKLIRAAEVAAAASFLALVDQALVMSAWLEARALVR